MATMASSTKSELYNLLDSTESRRSKGVYKSVDELKLSSDDYHRIEDFISIWLLTHTEMIPRCYVIVLAGMMRKRVLNARIRGTTLDSRHTKNVICVLMVILIYLHKIGVSDMEVHSKGHKDSSIRELLTLFHYYYQLVHEFIERDKEVFSGQVRKSLSLVSKLKDRGAGAGSGSGSGSDSDDGLKKHAFQYDFVRENFNRITDFLSSSTETTKRESLYQEMVQNHIIQSIYDSDISTHHSAYFKLPVEALNTQYKEISIHIYLDD